MADINQAARTQLKNIEKRTGKSLNELTKIITHSGLTKHGQIRDMLKDTLALGHGDAAILAHYALNPKEFERRLDGGISESTALDNLYTGAKANLRPIHEALMDAIHQLGEFEIAPKKGYISLRRTRQFAMLGPATNSAVEVGFNMKNITPTQRLIEQKPGGMCQYKVRLSSLEEIDTDLIGWFKTAYESAG